MVYLFVERCLKPEADPGQELCFARFLDDAVTKLLFIVDADIGRADGEDVVGAQHLLVQALRLLALARQCGVVEIGGQAATRLALSYRRTALAFTLPPA